MLSEEALTPLDTLKSGLKEYDKSLFKNFERIFLAIAAAEVAPLWLSTSQFLKMFPDTDCLQQIHKLKYSFIFILLGGNFRLTKNVCLEMNIIF